MKNCSFKTEVCVFAHVLFLEILYFFENLYRINFKIYLFLLFQRKIRSCSKSYSQEKWFEFCGEILEKKATRTIFGQGNSTWDRCAYALFRLREHCQIKRCTWNPVRYSSSIRFVSYYLTYFYIFFFLILRAFKKIDYT